MEFEELTPSFASEVHGFDPSLLADPDAVVALRTQFDRRGVLRFRDVGITHAEQAQLSMLLIGELEPDEDPDRVVAATGAVSDDFYISNRREKAAAPFGRLQYHSDTMWAAAPIQVLSLYGLDVEPPVAPTTWVSTVRAWDTLPPELRARAEAHEVLHAADGFRRGDLTDVFVSSTANPRSLVAPIGQAHPRTGETMLFVCEQMTKSVVGLDPDESEALLQELFAHLYDPDVEWHHDWRERDLVVWDNLATQHARHVNVRTDGPARTLRKVARPVITLDPDEVPVFRAGRTG